MVIVLLLGVLAAAGIGLGVLAGGRALQRQAAAERDDAVRAAVEAATATVSASAAADREATVRAAVDTVLQVAGEKFADQRGAAAHELDLRSRTIAEQVSGLNQSFEQRVSGLNQSFEQQLSGMHHELQRVGELVTQLQHERAAQHGQVVESIRAAARQTASLSEVTQGLREVLASSRTRGQWGERMADDVLRASGLVEGINYCRQRQLAGGTRPDVTFFMPNDRLLHMDVKFPIDNYVRYLDAATPTGDRAAADAHRAQFVKDVRQRIKEVTTRDYVDEETTLGYVLLFIPNESVYSFVHETDPELVDVALRQRVVLCSPFTLFAVLGVVRQAVESVQLQRTSDEILDCLGSFTAQWTKFSESLDLLGRRFESAQKAYDDLAGTRRRQLVKSLDEIDRLRDARGLSSVEAAGPAAVGGTVDVVELGPARPGTEPSSRAGSGGAAAEPTDASTPPELSGARDHVVLAAGSEHDAVPTTAPTSPRVPRLRPIRGR